MNKPLRAPRTARNLAPKFDETLAIPLGYRPAAEDPVLSTRSHNAREISFRRVRILLIAIWILATLMAGVGIGGIIRDSLRPAAVSEAPAPVAAADVAVAAAVNTEAAAGTVAAVLNVASAPASNFTGQIVPSFTTSQAASGSTFATVNAGALQGATRMSELQPGYVQFGHAQGNIGTNPIN